MIDKKPTSIKDQMAEALMILMQSKEFTGITVTDVVKQANVGRASFYRYFNSTNEILEYISDKLFSRLSEEFLPVFKAHDERRWRDCLFRFLYDVSDLKRSVSVPNPVNISLVINKIDEKIQIAQVGASSPAPEDKYRIAASIGIINSIVHLWINENMSEPAEDIVNTLVNMLMSI